VSPAGVNPAHAAAERLVREVQRDHRVPAVSAAICRADREPWAFAVGTGTDTVFRIGSVTKTFTAVLVMQARDEGLLDLDDPLSAHLDVPAHGSATIRRMLSHTAGFQREPYGDIWDTLAMPPADQLVADLARAEAVLPPGRRWHYSNLAYALLGHLAARRLGGTWEEVLADRLLRPLGLTRTSATPTGPTAQGYLVEAYSDAVHPEDHADFGGVGPATQLWSTAGDMAQWAEFLAAPDPAVLRPGTLEEMCHPVTVTDPDEWHTGWGLGLLLAPRGGRVVHIGHPGAMPGFLAGVYARRDRGIGAAVLGSSGTAGEITVLAHALIEASLEQDPPDVAPWTPGEPAPAEYASVLGRWFSEGFEYVFRWRNGHLEARPADLPAERPPAVFAVESADLLRTVSGREAGEQLRLTRDAGGRIVTMHWATYRFTRDQERFGTH
jgi:CubicO group peptidase (beta-lactamase class C family)